MKKFLASIATVATTAALLVGCGAQQQQSTSSSSASSGGATSAYTEADLGEGFVFKHGFDQDFPPYAYIDDTGKTNGFDVELAQAVCSYYNWEYKAVPFNWDAKDAELNAGSCDCIWSGFTINGREDDYQWSKPYSDNKQMILVKKDSGINKLTDLASKKVGVQTSTSAYDMLASGGEQEELAKTFSSLEVYETYTIAYNDLKAGAIDAIAIDVTTGDHLTNGDTNYVYLDETLGNEQYGVGFRKGDTVLCKKIDEALDALAANGTFDTIGKKYPEIYEYLSLGK